MSATRLHRRHLSSIAVFLTLATRLPHRQRKSSAVIDSLSAAAFPDGASVPTLRSPSDPALPVHFFRLLLRAVRAEPVKLQLVDIYREVILLRHLFLQLLDV